MRCFASVATQNMGERSATSEPHTLCYTPRGRSHARERSVALAYILFLIIIFHSAFFRSSIKQYFFVLARGRGARGE